MKLGVIFISIFFDLLLYMPKTKKTKKTKTKKITVIGQGTFGCVHKPSLLCENTSISEPNTVSKILLDDDAHIEQKEYTNIAKIDPKKYTYLGNPTTCKVRKTRKNIDAIKKCKNGDDMAKQLSHYSLLIMPDGGDNLATWADKQSQSTKEIQLFWKNAIIILESIQLYLSKGYIHHDLKPQNIVISNKNVIRIIDFGKMRTEKDVMGRIGKGSVKSHWSYPVEFPFLTEDGYDYIKTHTILGIDELNTKFSKFKTNYQGAQKYICDDDSELKNKMWNAVISLTKQIHDGVLPRDELIKKTIQTIDIYGAGISYLYVLYIVRNKMPNAVVNEFSSLFYDMVTPNVIDRINIEQALKRYRMILQIYNVK